MSEAKNEPPRRGTHDDAAELDEARLLSELRLHQVELETQNEELRESRGLLEASRARFVDLYDFSPVAYLTLDEAGSILQTNLTCARLLGLERSYLIGKPLQAVAPFHDSGAFFEMLKGTFAQRAQETFSLSFTRRSDGRDVILHVLRAPTNELDRLEGRCSFALIDVSEERRLEEERAAALAREQAARASAEKANRLKDEFLSIVSHELRTPLNAILGWAQLLISEEPLEPRILRQGIEVILRNTTAQARLVEDLLDMSRMTTSNLRVERTVVAVAPIVRAAFEAVEATVTARGITVRLDLDRRIRVLGDAARLQQVVQNLLSNAIKFSKEGASIDVTLEAGIDDATLRVKDTGDGIAPEALLWIFDRFRQVDGGRTRSKGGLGLGLSIARHIVEAHGGNIRAFSDGGGTGATFTVTLPREPDEQDGARVSYAALSDRASTASSLRAQGLSILVVDDDPDAREIATIILSREGAKVTAVDNVQAAIDELVTRAPDVLISDIGMPGEDGLSLISRVRRMHATAAHVPAIALTAYARPEDAAVTRAAGFDVHIVKPCEPEALIEAIASLVRRKRSSALPER